MAPVARHLCLCGDDKGSPPPAAPPRSLDTALREHRAELQVLLDGWLATSEASLGRLFAADKRGHPWAEVEVAAMDGMPTELLREHRHAATPMEAIPSTGADEATRIAMVALTTTESTISHKDEEAPAPSVVTSGACPVSSCGPAAGAVAALAADAGCEVVAAGEAVPRPSKRMNSRLSAHVEVTEEQKKKWQILDYVSEKHEARKSTTEMRLSEEVIELILDQETFTLWLRNAVRSPRFEWFTAIVIILNAFFVGLQVEVAARSATGDVPIELEGINICFVAFYVSEILLRCWAEGIALFFSLKIRHRTDLLWNAFDITVIVVSVFEVVTHYAFVHLKENATFLLTVRVARLIRIIRIVRIIRFLRELRIMVYSIFHTLKSLFWSFLLLGTVMYLFAIVLTQSTTDYLQEVPGFEGTASVRLDAEVHCNHPDWRVREHFDDPCVLVRYFGSLPSSMDTLFESVSGGVSWGDRAAILGRIHWSVEAYFMLFVSFTLFAMLNVITGFFCETAVDMAAQDREHAVAEQMNDKQRYVKEMEGLFKDIDKDTSGTISLDELESVLDDELVRAYFASLHLDINSAWDAFSNKKDIFKLLDKDGSKTVDLAEFALGCLRLRGSARTVDLASVQYEVEKLVTKLSYFMAYVECEFQHLGHTAELEDEPMANCPEDTTSAFSAAGMGAGVR